MNDVQELFSRSSILMRSKKLYTCSHRFYSPAGLSLPPPSENEARASFHFHPDWLHALSLPRQVHQNDLHDVPSNGNNYIIQ